MTFHVFLIQWNVKTLIHEIVALINVYSDLRANLTSNAVVFVALSMEFVKRI